MPLLTPGTPLLPERFFFQKSKTIEKGVASGIPKQPLPYMAIGTFYVKRLDEYQAAIGPNSDAIRADSPITPICYCNFG